MANYYQIDKAIAARKDLTASAKIVLGIIIDHIGKNANGWPGVRLIQQEAGMHRQTVINAIRNLETTGLIVVYRQDNGKRTLYSLPETGTESVPVQKVYRSGTESVPLPVQKVYRTGTETVPELPQELPQGTTPRTTPPFDEIMNLWNSTAKTAGFHPFTAMNDARKGHIRTRWKEQSWRENWEEAIRALPDRPFCLGQNDRNWKADFDWFLYPGTVIKLVEGIKYMRAVGGNGQSGGNGGGPLFTSTGLGAKCTIYPGLTKQQTADGFVRVIRDDTFRTVSAAEVAAARADADIWPEVERQIGREV